MNNKPQSKIQELFDFDKTNKVDFDFVIGTDEAGRGPGAGPVFAAAVCFLTQTDADVLNCLSLLNDSKQLTEKKREDLFKQIKKLEQKGKCICFVQEGSVEQIEKMNILNTSLDCMKKSCENVANKLGKKKIKVLVDGNRLIKNFSLPQMTVIKGDSKSASIAAASILAKVTRDRFMDELAKEFPQYCWQKNKGYLSSAHIEAIKNFGITKWHRKKFLRNILAEQKEEQLSLF